MQGMALLGPGQGIELCEITTVKTKLLECFRICKALSPALAPLLLQETYLQSLIEYLLHVGLSSR